MAVFCHFPYRYFWEKCYGNPEVGVQFLNISITPKFEPLPLEAYRKPA